MRAERKFLYHEPCPSCGSSDAGSRYDNGDLYCFSCDKAIERGHRSNVEIIEPAPTKVEAWSPLHGHYCDLPKRALKEATLRHWQYQVGEYNGQPCQIANYYDQQRVRVCQKLRTADKSFPTLGNGRRKPLYGQWLSTGGKHLVITEGELDALSVSQAFDLKWPVVSLPDGAASAVRTVEQHYDWLNKFDRIVLMLDMDDAGRKAASEIAPMLPAGRVCIASLPEKDANDVLVKHGPGAIVRAFWDAPAWQPDGIVSGEDMTLDSVMAEASKGYELPYPMLQEKLLGLRKGELTLITAGSGIGKSTWAREIAYHLRTAHGLSIGNVFLEERNSKTAQGYVAIHNNVPLGRLRHDKDLLTREQWEEGMKATVWGGMYFYDHFGSLESKQLLSKLHYLAAVRKVDFIILDHISIVTSGLESSSEGERKDIDILMTKLRSLVEETGIGVVAIVHLKRVQGKSFNEGASVALNDLRGSASLEQLSDNVLALERDQQGDNPNVLRVRVLKCREIGDTGEADVLTYNRDTGRITAVPDMPEL